MRFRQACVVVGLVGGLVSAGCYKSPLRHCQKDSDCVDQVCDLKYHFCVPKADAGLPCMTACGPSEACERFPDGGG